MILEARGVAAGYNGRNIVSDVSFSLASGEVLCLLGPNGVGKTTLFKALLGFIPFTHGGLFMDGERVNHSDRRRLASYIGYVPQVHEPPFPFSVLDVVVMGSVVRESLFGGPSRKAYREAEATLERLGVSYLRDKVYTEVSGGERQMVLIARALMQKPAFLMMDEPTSSLDYGNQMRVLSQVKSLSEEGVGVIMTSHFPDHAYLACSKAVVMSRTEPFHVGPVDEIVTESILAAAYGIKVKVADLEFDDVSGGKLTTCIPVLPGVHAPGMGWEGPRRCACQGSQEKEDGASSATVAYEAVQAAKRAVANE